MEKTSHVSLMQKFKDNETGEEFTRTITDIEALRILTFECNLKDWIPEFYRRELGRR